MMEVTLNQPNLKENIKKSTYHSGYRLAQMNMLDILSDVFASNAPKKMINYNWNNNKWINKHTLWNVNNVIGKDSSRNLHNFWRIFQGLFCLRRPLRSCKKPLCLSKGVFSNFSWMFLNPNKYLIFLIKILIVLIY